ncbi:hypothetical protein [Burkholderia sp. BCC0322]|uniref:hypothetical protein n=1 Tax=unclassified Burkholderia TaxID=2613784 RepID=UPI001FC8872D|nr:hypothetical protein [Burkholderia sp. BCC0322]
MDAILPVAALHGFSPPSSADSNRWIAFSVAPRCRAIASHAAADLGCDFVGNGFGRDA